MSYSPNRIAYYRDRCRPPLTQKALAHALGRHVNTIVLWEKRGAPAPADLLVLVACFVAHRAIGDEPTARQFWAVSGRDQFAIPPELAQLFAPAAPPCPEEMPVALLPLPAPVPPSSLLPLHRNRLFVGRAAELLALAAALRASGATAVVCGLGGVGKTQLVCEFAHRYGQFFPGGVFWISCSDPTALPAAVAACGCADHLALQPDFDALPLGRQVRLVQAAWRDPLPRLLIFDNCEDEALLAQWRPPTGGCRVIVTSQRAHWSPTLIDLVVALPALARTESVALLQSHAPDRPATDLDAVAAELGDLPLALHLAGAHLARLAVDCGPAHYLSELRTESAQFLAHPSFQSNTFSPTGHVQHVAQAFALSYRQLRPGEPADRQARALLARAAHFTPGALLPRQLLLASLAPDAATAGLKRLTDDLSLLEKGDDATLRIHRLVAGFVRALPPDPTAQGDVERVVLAEARRLTKETLPAAMLAFQHHVRAVADAAAPRLDTMAAELCAELGWQLVLLGVYDEGRRYIERSLHIREATLGPEHPATAESLSMLGMAYQYPGAFALARPLYERALAIWEHAYPADHPDVAVGHSNLGYLFFHLDDHAAARTHLRQALHSLRRTHGLWDATTARLLSNLGYVELRAGRRAIGRRYLRLALAIREQVLPAKHPSTAQTLNNLGEALLTTGDIAGAAVCHQRALAMREALFGVGHAQTSESLRNMAHVLQAQGQTAAARDYQERALAICEASFGERNIETGWNLAYLGELLASQGDTAAQTYLERALAIYTELLHEGHHDIALVREQLAQLR